LLLLGKNRRVAQIIRFFSCFCVVYGLKKCTFYKQNLNCLLTICNFVLYITGLKNNWCEMKKRKKDICLVKMKHDYAEFAEAHMAAEIVSINGQVASAAREEIAKLSNFPTEFVEEMVKKYHINKEIYGDIASKILVYNDKATGAPAFLINGDTWMSYNSRESLGQAFDRLNRAARNDVVWQMNLRKRMFIDYHYGKKI